MSEFWDQFFVFFSGGTAAALATVWFGRTFVEKKMQSAIQHGYNAKIEDLKHVNNRDLEKWKSEQQLQLEQWKQEQQIKLDERKREQLIRERGAAIAELISEWLSHPKEQKQLNKLTLEAYLWLPANILADLTQVLAHNPKAPDVREVIAKVRCHLLGDGACIPPEDVVIFTTETKSRQTKALFENNYAYIPSSMQREPPRGAPGE